MIGKTIHCPEIICSTNCFYFTSSDLVVWELDSQARVLRFKSTAWLQAGSDFDPSLVNQRNIRKSWNLVTQRKQSPWSGFVSQRQLNNGFCPTPPLQWGDLIWKFVKILWGQNFFSVLPGGVKIKWGGEKYLLIQFHYFISLETANTQKSELFL